MLKRVLMASVITIAAASAHAQVVLVQENFATGVPAGWVTTNQSTPGGVTGWYQGDVSQFAAQAGAADSYVAANYNNAPQGGTINNWLITSAFSTELSGTVSFWARAAFFDGTSDHIAYGLNGSGSSDTGTFSLGSAVTLSTSDWTQYTLNFTGTGAATTSRFAINYSGPADLSNYIGIDTLKVTAVPEPSTWLMLSVGMVGLIATRRRLTARV